MGINYLGLHDAVRHDVIKTSILAQRPLDFSTQLNGVYWLRKVTIGSN